MFPFVEFLGKQFPTYGLLSMGGVLLGLVLAVLLCRRLRLDWESCAYIYVFGGIGALVGAKVLYLLTVLPQLIQDLPLLFSNTREFIDYYMSGGLVFYGGLLGAIGGAVLCARYFSVRLRDYFPVLVPVFPLIHGIGRVGCFMAGCCYGMEVDWGIAFTNSPAAPNGVKLLPVQLIEAGAEGLICLFLLWYASRKPAPMRLLGAYFLAYAPVRFVLEFFRGDVERGIWAGVSTSQWISVAIFAAGLVLMYLTRPGKAGTNAENGIAG